MTPINRYFDKVFWINADEREDRQIAMRTRLADLGIHAERFRAHWKPVDHTGRLSANMGCTASHRGVLELICHFGWERTLILEDDNVFLDNFAVKFSEFVGQAPREWDFLFLGGSYADNPKRRLSPNVVQTNGLMTTSSYGITYKMARKMAPHISGSAGIDAIYHQFQRDNVCLMCSPRLCVQGAGYSDIQDREADHSMSMLDARHEEMLLDGKAEQRGEELILRGRLQRRELAAPHDANGEEVIVEGELYRIVRLELPAHRPSWFRDEPCTYVLSK